MERWLQGLPENASQELTLDLYYMEIRLGCWACPHLYGVAPFRATLIPFSDRNFVEACFALPHAYRRSRRSQHRMIELADAELLKTPFDRMTGMRQIWSGMKRNRLYSVGR